MKKTTRYILFTLLASIFLLTLSCSEKESEDLLFFYFESCPSCEEYEMAEEFNSRIQKLNKKRTWNAEHHNLISPEAGKKLKEVINEKGMPDISRSLPLLILGDEYINGYENIGEKLEELLSE